MGEGFKEMLLEWMQERLGTGHPVLLEKNDKVIKTPSDGTEVANASHV